MSVETRTEPRLIWAVPEHLEHLRWGRTMGVTVGQQRMTEHERPYLLVPAMEDGSGFQAGPYTVTHDGVDDMEDACTYLLDLAEKVTR